MSFVLKLTAAVPLSALVAAVYEATLKLVEELSAAVAAMLTVAVAVVAVSASAHALETSAQLVLAIAAANGKSVEISVLPFGVRQGRASSTRARVKESPLVRKLALFG